MRAQQEKLADKQAELDELRARRYQEIKEKEWQEKEHAEEKRKAEEMAVLSRARESQKAAKIRQLGDMALIEQQDFFRVLEASKAKALEEAQQACIRSLVTRLIVRLGKRNACCAVEV